jgi:hypothetical protein
VIQEEPLEKGFGVSSVADDAEDVFCDEPAVVGAEVCAGPEKLSAEPVSRQFLMIDVPEELQHMTDQ